MKEIVIKIPEDTYRAIKDDTYCGVMHLTLYDAIKNGKELPKGHTELIDTRILIEDVTKASESMKANGVAPVFDAHEIVNLILTQDVLVEADKGE